MNAMLALVDCTSFYVSCEKAFNVALRGKPVLVLTNNDACIAALSKEAKELGLKRGTPIFQCRDLIEKHQVVLLSSNYSLYHDMSARVMASLSAFSPQPLEICSIDEAFLDVTHVTAEDLAAYGRQIRAAVLQQTGIPTVVGLAATKTLTKVAIEIAKARPEYRHVLAIACISEEELDELLASVGVNDVFGIGPRYAAFLQAHGIYTAKDLKYANQRWIRKHLTVVGHRTQLELRGVVVLQKFLSSSKRNVFYNPTKVKRVKGVLVFSRRICFCSNYMLIFDELKNFCNTTFTKRIAASSQSSCKPKALAITANSVVVSWGFEEKRFHLE